MVFSNRPGSNYQLIAFLRYLKQAILIAYGSMAVKNFNHSFEKMPLDVDTRDNMYSSIRRLMV
jgi:hypothetical protein